MDEQTKPTIQLTGVNGNAFNIMAIASQGLKEAGYSKEDIKEYQRQAMEGDYDNLLQVTMKWCDVI